MSTLATQTAPEWSEDLGQAWNRFWFRATDPLPLARLRVVVGLLTAAYFACLSPILNTWYARDGALPPSTVRSLMELEGTSDATFHLSYLNYFPASTELWIIHALAVLVALAFAAGVSTRVTGVLSLVALLSYVHRIPQAAGFAEPVLAFLLAYLCLGPSAAYYSVDRLLARRRATSKLGTELPEPKPSVAANLPLRLIQVHLAMFYAMMGLTKLYGDAWWDGNGVWLLMAQTESRPFDLTGLRRMGSAGQYLLNLWSHTIVYFELAFPILIWHRLTRPILVALALFVWPSLMLLTGEVVFGLTMLAANLAFWPAADYGRKPNPLSR
jgi:hypothetical protein